MNSLIAYNYDNRFKGVIALNPTRENLEELMNFHFSHEDSEEPLRWIYNIDNKDILLASGYLTHTDMICSAYKIPKNDRFNFLYKKTITGYVNSTFNKFYAQAGENRKYVEKIRRPFQRIFKHRISITKKYPLKGRTVF